MKSKRNLLTGDWKRNWQQSIAVRISALALWVILPISLFITFYFINHLEENLKKQFIDNSDILAHRVQSYFDKKPVVNSQETIEFFNQQMQSLGFCYIKFYSDNVTMEFGKQSTNEDLIGRQIYIPSKSNSGLETFKITAQHPDLKTLKASKRNKILYPVVIGMIIFGVFLIWAIRSMVHRPLENLVDATQAVSDGITDLRLDTKRQDEFGYIARFFNEMLDQLLDQQERLKEAADDARIANNAKSSFLANMSHELRTPLNAIIGYSEILYERATDLNQKEFIQDLDRITTAGKYLLDLINNILDITKIETGRTEVFYEDINVEKMINEIRSTMAPLIRKNNNELILDIDADISTFRSDYTKLRQSLFNLLSNASKFTKDGKISLKVSKIVFSKREKLIFEISDTGTGMSTECLSNLFIPFTRGKNSNTLKISGTGLGLAISRYFCNLLGGEIAVESELGVGTTFKIHIPYIAVESGLNAANS